MSRPQKPKDRRRPEIVMEFHGDLPTTANWFPTVGGKVSVGGRVLSTGTATFSVWGDDDFGMEVEFHGSVGAATEWFRKTRAAVLRLTDVTPAALTQMGWQRA